MDDRLGRRDGESYDDTLVRLFENKDSLGLNCQQIADIMNKSFDLEYTESKYRKEFAAFNRGRIYERSRDQVHGRRILSISDLHVTVIEIIAPENEVTFQLPYPADADRRVEAPCVNINHIFQSRAVVYAIVGISCEIK